MNAFGAQVLEFTPQDGLIAHLSFYPSSPLAHIRTLPVAMNRYYSLFVPTAEHDLWWK